MICIAFAVFVTGILSGCGAEEETDRKEAELTELIWYQVGESQKDDSMVLEAVNQYIEGKIGVRLTIVKVGWADYSQKMQVAINTDEPWDMCLGHFPLCVNEFIFY